MTFKYTYSLCCFVGVAYCPTNLNMVEIIKVLIENGISFMTSLCKS